MDTKIKWIFATTLMLFLITGVLCGIMVERTVLAPIYNASGGDMGRRPDRGLPPPELKREDPMTMIASRMTEELSLTEAQQKELLETLEKYKGEFKTIRDETKNQFDELDKALADDTMKILTEEQKEKFNERFVRWPKSDEQGPGQRQGPPPQAFEACKGVESGKDCSFTDANGTHQGKCGHGAINEFVCMPIR